MQIDHLLKQIEKPSRYIGGEVHSLVKPFSEGQVRFGFAFPDVYEVGMSHMGLQILYFLLNDLEDVYCERLFAPWEDMEAAMRKSKTPLFTLETRTPAGELDILGFTLQYEMSYTNILNMLDLAGLPVHSRDRGDEAPLVIAGGPCAFNPEPLADFIDVVFIGDGEEILPEFIERFRRHRKSGAGKKAFLESIVDIPGIYVPAFYRPRYRKGRFDGMEVLEEKAPAVVHKSLVRDLDKAFFPRKLILPYADAVHDRAVLEIFRGCTRGCRFCHAGMIYRPVRERSLETALAIAEDLIESTGYEEISLASLSTSDYSNLGPLVDTLLDRYGGDQVGISLPSLRLDSFSMAIIQKIQSVRKTGLTFAPEAGTQRLRDVINKGIEEKDLLKSVADAFESGWDTVKLYFMIGLPTETDEDLDGIYDLAKKVVETYYRMPREKRRRKPRITVSVSNFVPKAFTPFQWERQDTLESLKRKHAYLSRLFKREKAVQLNYHDGETSLMESVFARGDRRMGPVLHDAWRRGCVFDSWSDFFNFETWTRALAEFGFEAETYASRFGDPDAPLPWDHIDAGIDKAFLLSEREKALRGELTPDCRQGCHQCGIMTQYRGACHVQD